MIRSVRRAGAVAAALALAWPLAGVGAFAGAGADVALADPVRDAQEPAFTAMDVPSAWKVTRGAGVTVGIVDSGVQTGQPELAGQVTTGPDMLAAIDGRTRPARLHGTSMAMLIAGKGRGPGGGGGVIGVAPQSRILAVRAIAEPEDPSFRAYKTTKKAEGATARGIRYVVDHGADVINLSIGRYDEQPDERDAIGYAVSKGVVVIAAVGNDGDKRRGFDEKGYAPYSYPASYPGVIAVAATNRKHVRAGFSNRNFSVLVAAPGVNLPGVGPEHGAYYVTDGTSDSTALVSGIAALIRSKHPKLAPALVAQALVASTPSGGASYDASLGHGEVNAAKALNAADRLATIPKGVQGKPGGTRFGAGGEPGPVTVIARPTWAKVVVVVVILGGVAGAVAAVAIAVTLARRHPNPDTPPQGMPPQAMPPQAMPPQFVTPQPPPSHFAPPPPAAPQFAPQGTPPQDVHQQAIPPQDAPPQFGSPQFAPAEDARQQATPPQFAPPQAPPAQDGRQQAMPAQDASPQDARQQATSPQDAGSGFGSLGDASSRDADQEARPSQGTPPIWGAPPQA